VVCLSRAMCPAAFNKQPGRHLFLNNQPEFVQMLQDTYSQSIVKRVTDVTCTAVFGATMLCSFPRMTFR
jgi:hypothetical protein